MRAWLRRRLLLTEAEWRIGSQLFVALALLTLGSCIGDAACTTLFLEKVGADAQPQAFLLMSCIVVGVTPIYLSALTRRSRRFTANLTTGLCAALLITIALAGDTRASAWLFFSLKIPIWTFTSTFFWTVVSERFEARQVRRVVPFVAAAGGIAAIIAGPMMWMLAPLMEMSRFSALWALCLIISAAIVHHAGFVNPRSAPEAGAGSHAYDLRASIEAARAVPLAKPLAVTVVTTVLAGWLISAIFNTRLASAYPDEATLATLQATVGSVINLACTILLLGFTERVTARFGLLRTLAAGPALVIGPTLILAAHPSLSAAISCRIIEQISTLALVTPCVTALLAAVPERSRASLQTLMSTLGLALGIGLTGAVMLVENAISPDFQHFVPTLAVIAWALSLMNLRRRYLETLAINLSGQHECAMLDSVKVLEQIESEAVDDVLHTLLDSGNPQSVRFVLELAAEPGFDGLASQAATYLASDDDEVRAQAARTLGRYAPEIAAPLLLSRISDVSVKVRLSVATGLEALLGDDGLAPEMQREVADAVLRQLRTESDPATAAALVSALAQSDVGHEQVAVEIRTLRTQGQTRAAALALRALPAETLEEEASALLSDADRDVRVDALASLRGPLGQPTLQRVIDMLDDISLEGRATEALGRAGRADTLALCEVLRSSPHVLTRARLCRALTRIGSPPAIETLTGALTDTSLIVRCAARAALASFALPLDEGDLRKALRLATHDAAESAIWSKVLEADTSPRRQPLIEALRERARETQAGVDVLMRVPDASSERAEMKEARDGREEGPDHDPTPEAVVDALAAGDDPFIARCARWARGDEDPDVTLMERLIFLRQIELFREMSVRDLAVVAEQAEEETFAAETLVFEEGTTGESLYIVTEGSVGVMKGDRMVAVVGVRECFGEMAILSGETRSATIRSLEPTRALVLRRTQFQALIEHHPRIAFPIFEMLSQRLRKATDLLRDSREAIH